MANQPPDAEILALIAAYQAQTADIREKVTSFIDTLWRTLGVYRNAQIAPFVNEVIPVVTGAEQYMASLTTSYLAVFKQLSIGGHGTPVGVNPNRVTGAATRNGVSPAEVYERPFHMVWRELGQGTDLDTAISRGLANAQKSAMTDLQRTKVLTSQEVLANDTKVAFYERVLEGTSSCGLCIVASTQRYHKEKLLPLHPGCDCGVAPGYGDSEHILHLPRLQDIHQAIEDTFGQSSPSAREIPGQYAAGKPLMYRDVLVIHEHGELGPVLGVRGQQFLGPGELTASTA